MICNGGSPTAFQAIAKGVPVLGIPGNLDQFLNMHYLEKNRLGITLRAQDVNDGRVAATAQHIMDSNGYTENARVFARIIKSYSTERRLAEAITKLSPS